MAIPELGKYLSQLIKTLPEGHPDRSFLQSMQTAAKARENETSLNLGQLPILERNQYMLQVDALGFTTRTRNVLGRLYLSGRVGNLDALRTMSDRDIPYVYGLGKKTRAEIRGKIPYENPYAQTSAQNNI